MKTCKTDFSPSKKMWNKNSWKLVLQIFLKHFGSSPQNQVWKFYNGLYSRFSTNPRSKTGIYNLGRELNCTCPLFNPLTPVPTVTGRDEPWPFFHFWRHHVWQNCIIYTQLLQEEKIFAMMPRSEWLAQWSLRYAQKCSKSRVKNSQQNFLSLHLAAPWHKLPVSMTLS